MKKAITEYTLSFGKYKGYTLDEVPASYLQWLDSQDWVAEKFPAIATYIKKNKHAIAMELSEESEDTTQDDMLEDLHNG